jgi:hypothetical protein
MLGLSMELLGVFREILGLSMELLGVFLGSFEEP